MLKIGLPKGNLLDKSIKFIKNLECSIYDNKLFYCFENFAFYLLKQRDIPMLINDGYIDFGITNMIWFKELRVNLKVIQEFNIPLERLSIITASKGINLTSKIVSCVTEYPIIAKSYFINNKLNINVYNINGSTEGLVPSVFDCSIDCVETGKTIKANNLCEHTVIMSSSPILLGIRDDSKISELVETNIYNYLRNYGR